MNVMNEPPILGCDNCGVCCLHLGHPQYYRSGHLKDPHWESLPDNLKKEIDDHIDGLTDMDLGEPCIWYDHEKKQCKHYEHRPQMCRDFEMDSEHCRRKRQLYLIES
jgi:Fe-S-cluster containining protein